MSKTATRTDHLKQAHDRLTEAVELIASGDDWKRMLKVASKFHRYSFNNHQVVTALSRSSHARLRLRAEGRASLETSSQRQELGRAR